MIKLVKDNKELEINRKEPKDISLSSPVLKGEKGDKGDKGEDGYTPIKGVDYFDGEKGEKGDKGEQGEQGLKGDKGDTGAKGETGERGAKGEKGDKGEPFTYADFTPEQLAALKGEKGDKGDTGAKGDKGDTGEQGLQGIQGLKGDKGDKGDAGYTPQKGVDYFDGAKGDTGAKGDKGDTGDKGEQGIQGEKGDKGDKGDTGATGAKGDTGDKGERGTCIWRVTTALSAYTTEVGGFTPSYRIALSTVKTQANADEVRVGDTILRNYYTYPVGYVSSSYVYVGAYSSIRGSKGADGAQGEKGDTGEKGEQGEAGKSAYDIAKEKGFNGTEAEWLDSLRVLPNITQEAGDSEELVMSQKAVTTLVHDTLGIPSGDNYETVDSVEEMVDTNTQYVLSSTGTIWTWGETVVDDTDRNMFDANAVSLNQNPDGTARNGSFSTDYIPVNPTESNKLEYWLTMKGSAAKPNKIGSTTQSLPYIYKIYYYNANKAPITNIYGQYLTYQYDSTNKTLRFKANTYTPASGTETTITSLVKYIRLLIMVKDSTATPITASQLPADIVIQTPDTKTRVDNGWYDTGLKPETGGGAGGNYVDLLTKLNKNTDDIKSLDSRITTLEQEDGTYTIPSYWDNPEDATRPNYLTNKINEIKALQEAGGKDVVNFMWFSDVHYGGSGTYTKNIGKVCKRVMDECNIPIALMNGDSMTAGVLSTEQELLNCLDGAWDIYAPIGEENLLLVSGNHEDVYGSNGDASYVNKVAPNKIWDKLYRPQSKDFRRVFGGNGTYYYLDNAPQKVRFICLNSCNYEGAEITNGTTKAMSIGFGTEQLDWFENVALQVEDGWQIVLAFHVPLVGSYSADYGTDYSTIKTIINAQSNIIAIFCGHMHRDLIYTNSDTGIKCPLLVISCATNTPYDGTEAERIAGTTYETVIDCVSINKATRAINTVRIGWGNNRAINY